MINKSKLRWLLRALIFSTVFFISVDYGVDAQDSAAAQRVPGTGVTVLETSEPIDQDQLSQIAAARDSLNPDAYRYNLDEDFQPYVNGGVNFAPASPALGRPRTAPTSGMVTAIVLFNDTSAVERVGPTDLPNNTSEQDAVNNTAATIRSEQASAISAIQNVSNATVVTQLSHVLNGAIINVNAADISRIEGLPQVQSVTLDQYGTLDNASSVPFIGAVAAWERATGFTGDGIDIGIIDSGIDYLHTNFAGPGTGYGSADTTTLDGSEFNSKVVSGEDYVGDGWVAGAPLVFDPDPWDCNGHGTHVAGTAGGAGVNADGTTYTGPYNATTDFDNLRVGPGVAPEARLHALKIGDCTPSVSFAGAISAIDNYVIPNALDVVNNSYGGPYGTPLEPLVLAFERATDAGVIMVGSAGNSGDAYFVNGDPNIANSNIAVASSVSDVTYQGLAVTELANGNTTTEPASASVNGNPAIPPIGPMSLIPVGGTGGCTPSDYTGFTPGADEAAVIRWDDGTCGSVTRMTNAVNNGNVDGLVVITTDPADAPFILLSCGFNSGGVVVTSSLPCVSVQASADYLYTSPGDYEVTFDGTLTSSLNISLADTVSSFTSRGPVIAAGGNVQLKPDVAAPGDLIFSAASGTGTEGVFLGGTSMAAPHVAGVAAVLHQAYPSYTPQQIKSLIMNTATNDLWTGNNQTGDNFAPPRIGAGRVDILNALQHRALAYSSTNPEGVSVSFGVINAINPGTVSQNITVENTSSIRLTYNAIYTSYLDMNGATVSVSPARISLQPGETAEVTVTLTYDPAQMDENSLVDPTMSATQATGFGTLPRNWHREESGYVTFIGNGADLRVPVHAMPRPASERSVVTNPSAPGTIGSTSVDIEGAGVDTSGTLTPDQFSVVSRVSGFNALVTLPNDAFTDATLDRGDIQHIGITSDYQAQLVIAGGDVATAISNTTIYIGFTTYGEWSTHQPYDVLYDMYFDPEEDGSFQINVFNWDGAALFGLDFTDTPLNLLYDSGSFASTASFNNGFQATTDMYPFNNNVVMVPILATWLGLSDTNTDFSFDFGTLVDLNGYFDYSPTFVYDVTTDEVFNFNDASGTNGGPFTGVPTWFDIDPFDLPVDYDFSVVPPAAAPMLLLHHHNARPETRGELVFFNAPSITLDKTLNTTDAVAGDEVTYTITMTNNGPGDLTSDHVLIDQMPAGLTHVSDTCPTPSTVTGNVLECVVPATIADGASVSMDVVMQIDPAMTPGTQILNTVEVALALEPAVTLEFAESLYILPEPPRTGGGGGGEGGDAGGEGSEGGIDVFDPAISKLGFLVPGQVGAQGESLEWVVTVSNPSGVTGQNVVVTDVIDSRLQINNVQAPGASVDVTGQTVTVTYATLAPGQSVQFSIFTTTLDGEIVTNTACVVSATSAEECATGSNVAELPRTGETPPWRMPLIGLLLAGFALAGSAVVVRRRRQSA